MLIEDQELQINGFILIIDWSNFSFKQASKLTPSILKLAIEGLQVGGEHHVPVFFVTAARGTCPSTGQGAEVVRDRNPKCLYPIHLQHRLIFRCFIFTVFCFFFSFFPIVNRCNQYIRVTYCSIKKDVMFRDLRFNPLEKSRRLKFINICFLQCAADMQAKPHSEGG